MLFTLIERIFIYLTNSFTYTAAGARASRPHGLVVELLRRLSPAPAAVPAPPADPPVIIGTIIPSAREMLRQGGAAPLPVTLDTAVRSKHLYYVVVV